MSARLKIVVVGAEAAGAQAARLVAAKGHELVATLAPVADGPVGPLRQAASALGVACGDAADVAAPALAAWIADAGVDLLLNVHSLHVASAEVVAAPRLGSFNVHPGLLPAYPGLNAPSWAIQRGETRHGVTVHRMAAEIDAGPIAYETTFPIEPNDTGLTLSVRCAREGLLLLERLLDDAGGGQPIPARPQRGSAVVSHRGPPHDGRVPWERPAREIADFVRACDFHPFASPWAHPRARYAGIELEVLRATALEHESPRDATPGTILRHDGGTVLTATGDRVLRVSRVRVDGRSEDAAAVLTAGMEPVAERAAVTRVRTRTVTP